ncbi:MAG: hypothetical protein FWC33_02600 [Candidatus Bathyarchaeota archaeon]|nr:hypothetical protein [Candidatus Termiticorpusculum sp.]
MLYQSTETKTSQEQMQIIFAQLETQTCLLGGWAVYYLVNENFQKATGKTYIGSRDIDLGFHMNMDWTQEQLKNSEFATTIKIAECMGFNSVSFRLVKDFDIDTGKELAPEESAKRPLYQIFQLYIDPIVDCIHPEIKNLLGFVPIDEPLLSLIFQEKMYRTQSLFGKNVLIPEPHVMLAMKLNSAPKRDKEHKLLKDIADIYALLWYSDIKLSKLKEQLFAITSKETVKQAVRTFSIEDINKVATILGINNQEISRVLKEIL